MAKINQDFLLFKWDFSPKKLYWIRNRLLTTKANDRSDEQLNKTPTQGKRMDQMSLLL